MIQYQTPGVYYERVDTRAPQITAVRTDVAGFVGIAARGPLDTPVPVESWRQFQAHFGGFGVGMLAYTVRAFFENGGRRCWVVRVASLDSPGGALAASVLVSSPTGKPVWRIAASSPGFWGNALTVRLVETHRVQLTSRPDGSTPQSTLVPSVTGLVRGSLVRISQGCTTDLRVVSEVDPGEGLVYWVNPVPERRLSYERLLTTFDPNNSLLIESIEYTLLVWEGGSLIAEYERLGLVPEGPNYGPQVLGPIVIPSDLEPQGVLPPLPQPVEIQEQRELPLASIEPLHVTPLTALTMIADPTHVQLESAQGLAAGSILELVDPCRPDLIIGAPLAVALVAEGTPAVITLDGPGMAPAQIVAQGNAILAGKRLGVRLRNMRLDQRILSGGSEGLASLRVYDLIGEDGSPLDDDTERRAKQRGLRALERIDEVAIVAIPDVHVQPIPLPPLAPLPPCVPDPCLPAPPPVVAPRVPDAPEMPPGFNDEQIYQVQAALVQHCEDRRDRIALLDPPRSTVKNDQLGVSAIQAWRRRFDSKYAALYFPWVRVVDPLRAGGALTRDIPPSGHVAGQYADTDLRVGVHKAPANSALGWIQDVTLAVDDATHGLLNPEGINVLRAFAGRGLRIYGARTVSSDPDWRFVNVRRLLMMIEKAIDHSIQWAVFEPNEFLTRAKIGLTLSTFLLSLWRQGALMGDTAAAAFQVKCDDENNPPSERANGRLLAEVRVAPSVPFEFVILRVGRVDNEFDVTEMGQARGER